MRYKFNLLISLPKTIYFNFRAFPLRTAVKLPVLVSYDTKIDYIRRNSIVITAPIRFGVVQIGFIGTNGVVTPRSAYIRCGEYASGKIVVNGEAKFGRGSLIAVDRGVLSVGNGLVVNNNLFLSCNHSICFGNNVYIGWNVSFMDSDNHTIYYEGVEKKSVGNIYIGDNTWIASDVKIIKNTHILNDSIVATGSLVAKKYDKGNLLIGGNPAKVLRENVTWDKNANWEL